jgi:glutamate synthase (NADPH/NADH) small chain
MLGHDAVVYCSDSKPGGLNEYGIAAYKTVDDFAQKEIAWILDIGGIEIRPDSSLGKDVTLEELRNEFDAVFLGVGLGGVNDPGIDGGQALNAVDFIAELRQADDKSRLAVGRRVVVIGGGMTAIDVAVQSKRLGSGDVQIVYRRGPGQMSASTYEQELAQTSGVIIRHWAAPVKLETHDGVQRAWFENTELDQDGSLHMTGDRWHIDADVVFKAVGQQIDDDTQASIPETIAQHGGKLKVDDERRTSLDGVWAGGDCIHGHDDLTVTAVQDGKLAALSIDRYLRSGETSNG